MFAAQILAMGFGSNGNTTTTASTTPTIPSPTIPPQSTNIETKHNIEDKTQEDRTSHFPPGEPPCNNNNQTEHPSVDVASNHDLSMTTQLDISIPQPPPTNHNEENS
jgi:hypothetical protein